MPDSRQSLTCDAQGSSCRALSQAVVGGSHPLKRLLLVRLSNSLALLAHSLPLPLPAEESLGLGLELVHLAQQRRGGAAVGLHAAQRSTALLLAYEQELQVVQRGWALYG